MKLRYPLTVALPAEIETAGQAAIVACAQAVSTTTDVSMRIVLAKRLVVIASAMGGDTEGFADALRENDAQIQGDLPEES